MKSFFNLEGPFISFLDKTGRIILLSVLWVICSIPIITVGASTSALYYGIAKNIVHERSSVFKVYFGGFKRVIKSGIIFSILSEILLALLLFDAYIWYQKASKTSMICFNICIVLALIILMIVVFLFPVLSRFNFEFKEYLRFSFYLAFKHLPVTFMVLVIVIAVITLGVLIPFSLLVTPGLGCLCATFFIEKTFKKYIPKAEEGKELWYDE